MKRVLSMLLAACLCCGLLAGCSKGDRENDEVINRSASKTG